MNDAHLIEFHTHDEIDPVCGKTMQHLGEVGIMSENCLRRLKFFYKIRKASVPDILAIQICPRRKCDTFGRFLRKIDGLKKT